MEHSVDLYPEKFLIVGEGSWSWYETACSDALNSMGVNSQTYSWSGLFRNSPQDSVQSQYRSQMHRVEARLGNGPITYLLNKELKQFIRSYAPNYILFYNTRQIYPETIAWIRKKYPKTIIGLYANDDPFSPEAIRGFWRHFLKSIPFFDLTYCFRPSNIPDFYAHGAADVRILLPYYVPNLHFPIDISTVHERYMCDVVFVGHFEDDGRLEALEQIAANGHKVNVFGGNWHKAAGKISASSPLRSILPVEPVIGSHYRQALMGSKLAVGFLSSLNRDVYTTRNFEIPAMAVPLLSQYSAAQASMFTEGKEIEFFRDQQELLQKTHSLLRDEVKRNEMAAAAYDRVQSDNHHVGGRMSSVLDDFRQKAIEAR